MKRLTEEQAIELLKKYSSSEKDFEAVLKHSKNVQKEALRIAAKVKNTDKELIKIGSLLHDIGRFRKDLVYRHGLNGAEMLRKEGFEEYAKVAERHLGAGISKQDIKKQKLKLPMKDFVPLSKEEKIISYADNLIEDNKLISVKQVIKRYKDELGEEVAEKIKKQHEEIMKMMKE